MDSQTETAPPLYTVGHSNHTLEKFLALLSAHNIEVLIDTRSSPYSRYSPHFNREVLKAAAEADGLKYGFYGRELGGRPDDETYYDDEGHVAYAKLARSFLFQEGLERLLTGSQKLRTAILCSEENPSICHRRLLVSRVLYEAGVPVLHIRGTGAVESEEELRRLESEAKGQNRSLFEEFMEEVPVWRSIQSVSPEARRSTFSHD